MAPNEKIRVIIVDDIAETRENIRKLLQFENDVEVVGVARTGREGIDVAKELKPDVMLMDINMPDMDGITATENIRKAQPYIQIIILSVQNDSNYMRRAMLAGARDFLSKPPTVDELTGAIRRAGVMAKEEKAKLAAAAVPQAAAGGGGFSAAAFSSGMNGKIVTIYSPKGGTGATTLATNLAVCLQSDDTPVILVDGNLQFGDVAIFLNQQSKFSAVDLATRVNELDNEFVESVIVKHTDTGIRVLTAPFRPEYAENVNGDQFGKILNYLRRMFSYVVVDTASALTDITLSVLDQSDLIVLVTTQEIPAIKNARLFLDLADALGIERRRILFTMNRYDRRISISPEKVSENFKLEMAAVIPFDDRTVVPAVNKGVPFVTQKTLPISRTVMGLADAVRGRLNEMGNPQAETVAKSSMFKGKK